MFLWLLLLSFFPHAFHSGRCVVDPDTDSVNCVPHCQLQGLDDCQCSNESSCLVCCLNSSSVGDAAQCQPLLREGSPIFVADGISCVNGLCYQVSNIQRIWLENVR